MIALIIQTAVIVPVLILALTRFAFIGLYIVSFSLILFSAIATGIYSKYQAEPLVKEYS
jgi:hypothetical protein